MLHLREKCVCRPVFLIGVVLTTMLVFAVRARAQCPDNIDFERGDFTGWTCYTGTVYATAGGQNVISLTPSGGPVPDRHTMLSSFPGGGIDPYGLFPVNCPNGSGHSIKLGNNTGGAEAEGVSYEFNIPAGRDVYSLIYHYAVVFEDPNHLEFQQPRMEIEVLNVTDNQIIECSSFTFRPYGTPLPGFELAPFLEHDDTPIWYKPWSAVSINLNGNAGKRIRMTFKTADCTFQRHFGYAYIDVNSECSDEFVGAAFCPDDTAVNVVAPYGYAAYTWWDKNFTHVLGTSQNLVLRPVPPTGTVVAVEIVPYSGYGCLDTLYAQLVDTLTVRANAGPDQLSCNGRVVQLGEQPRPGIVYQWSPTTGLSDPNASNPLVTPTANTTYTLTARSYGGGCVTTDQVFVKRSFTDTSLQLIGRDGYCIGYNDSSVLQVVPTTQIEWYRDGVALNAQDPRYRPLQTGGYQAVLKNPDGCVEHTRVQQIYVESARPGIRYPEQFVLMNTPFTLSARKFGEFAFWSPGDFLNSPYGYTPVFTGTVPEDYTIAITTRAYCVTMDSQLVTPIKEVQVLVPSAFTPNNDGKNDRLKPLLYGVKKLNYFRIYNRGGQLIYQTTAEENGWDGTIRAVPQASQVVVWTAEAVGLDDKIYRRKGTTVLIR